jgi:hypothetical protein
MTTLALKALFIAICFLESNNNPNAINGKAVGIVQIQPTLISELNKWGYHYTLNDRLSACKSEEMFDLYTSHYVKWLKIEDNVKNRANIWRYGPYGRKGDTPYALKAQSLVDKALRATF